MARNPKGGDSSTSTSAPAKSRSSRASNPSRPAASKRTKYFDDDVDVEDGQQASQSAALGGLPGLEPDEEDDEEERSSTFEIAELVKAYAKKREKKEKAEAAKLEKQLHDLLAKGQTDADAAIEAGRKKCAALTSSLPLDEAPQFTQIDPVNYREAFRKHKRCADNFAGRIDEYLCDLRNNEHELLQDASERLDERETLAKRTARQLSKATTAIVEERHLMNQMHQEATVTTYRHLKGVARA
ncbi:hypothetical protein JCM10295v2_001718 [Rhodotorula toruloides]